MGTKLYEILIEDNLLCPDGKPEFNSYALYHISAISPQEARHKFNSLVLTELFHREILNIKELK